MVDSQVESSESVPRLEGSSKGAQTLEVGLVEADNELLADDLRRHEAEGCEPHALRETSGNACGCKWKLWGLVLLPITHWLLFVNCEIFSEAPSCPSTISSASGQTAGAMERQTQSRSSVKRTQIPRFWVQSNIETRGSRRLSPVNLAKQRNQNVVHVGDGHHF